MQRPEDQLGREQRVPALCRGWATLAKGKKGLHNASALCIFRSPHRVLDFIPSFLGEGDRRGQPKHSSAVAGQGHPHHNTTGGGDHSGFPQLPKGANFPVSSFI